MKIYISSKLKSSFVFEYVPTFIYKKCISELYSSTNKSKVEKVLKENNLTLDKFKDELKKSFSVKRFGNYYIISIKQNNEVEKLIRIIDYGNIGFKGLNIFNNVFKYTNENLSLLYSLWMKNMNM